MKQTQILCEFVFDIKNDSKNSNQWDLERFRNFFQWNQQDALISHIYPWNGTLNISAVSLSIFTFYSHYNIKDSW
jgi:hypothetical protein